MSQDSILGIIMLLVTELDDDHRETFAARILGSILLDTAADAYQKGVADGKELAKKELMEADDTTTDSTVQ